MNTIHRYALDLTDEPKAQMPLGAQVLSVSTARGQLECWALVDPAQREFETRSFHVVGTGNPIPDRVGRFIGTVMIHGGVLVFHVFEDSS